MSRIRLSTPLPPELSAWLKDVYPAWLQLPPDDFYRLVPFNSAESPLSLNYIGNAAEIGGSAVFDNLRIFLSLISEGKIVLQQNSTMTSDSLELLVDATHWPNHDFHNVKNMRRPLDEENICPLDFLKALAIESQLVEVNEKSIIVTPSGRLLLENRIDVAIVRRIFAAAFSKVNPRTLTKLAHPWVQEQTGIIFWGLSLVADQPRSADQLTRYCFVPPKQFFDYKLMILPVYMRAVFLNPLIWFGLMETQTGTTNDTNHDGVLYKKSALFDEFFHFDLEREQPIERAN